MIVNGKTKTLVLTLLFLLAGATLAAASGGGGGGHGGGLGEQLSLFMGIPFVGILLSIALLPLVAPSIWHHHFGKIAAFWGVSLAIPFLFMYRLDGLYQIFHIYLADYIPFIILLWALYTVAGGILFTGSLSGSPVVNCVLLLIGTVIASWVGTTGAAMLLIRPFMRANAWRKNRTYQIVFFIFLVCNVGGSLTPLGDPPLFLGFLKGVPFFWTMKLLAPMSVMVVILIITFFLLDTYHFRKEEGSPPNSGEKLKIEGLHNLIFIGGIIAAVIGSVELDKLFNHATVHVWRVELPIANVMRDATLVLMGILSLRTTKKVLREKNEFTWFPIVEVAYLFAGIFVTMVPVLLILQAGSKGEMAFLTDAVTEPVHYFWVTGILSSFLDNAPTYLVFLNTALGNFFAGIEPPAAIDSLIKTKEIYLLAISCGAVFMGANSYIGNAPNFMVRSIAEEGGVAMPSFFGYILKYSLVFLLPCFVVVTYIFFI